MAAISVIVPVYKAEAYLADCVESILAQTFTDFEIILVDDGSPDNCGKLCDEYASRYSNIVVLHQKNQGQAAARNHAMARAKGDWICFVDSDDLIHPQILEVLYRAAQESGAAISMCAMLEAVTLPEDFSQERACVFETFVMDERTLLSLHDADEYPGWVACAKLIRRDIVEHYPFREGRVYEDNEAVCRWICQAGLLTVTREKLYFYRGNPESTTKSKFNLKQLDYLWALESIIGFYGSLEFEELRQRFITRYIDAVYNCCNGVRYVLENPETVKQIEKNTRRFLCREHIKLTERQTALLLEVMHPKLVRIYWPISGAVTTLKQQGIAGLLDKIRKRNGKGEG